MPTTRVFNHRYHCVARSLLLPSMSVYERPTDPDSGAEWNRLSSDLGTLRILNLLYRQAAVQYLRSVGVSETMDAIAVESWLLRPSGSGKGRFDDWFDSQTPQARQRIGLHRCSREKCGARLPLLWDTAYQRLDPRQTQVGTHEIREQWRRTGVAEVLSHLGDVVDEDSTGVIIADLGHPYVFAE